MAPKPSVGGGAAQAGRELDGAITEVYVRVVSGRASVILCLGMACAAATPEPIPQTIPKECPELPVSQYPQKEVVPHELALMHRALAQEKSETGDEEGALIHYRCALVLDPALPDTRIELAAILVSRASYAEAQAELVEIHEHTDPDFRSRTLLASALEGLGQLRAAADELARAADETRSSAVLYRRAADLYLRSGEAELAEALKVKADELDPPKQQREMRPLVEAKPPPKSGKKKKKKK
jgi:tetratricopeptide (TPR) repeat protein